MRRALALALIALAAGASAAVAQGPPARITIVSLFDPITYGDNAYVNGQLIGNDDQANQLVTLQAAPYPFTTWADAAQITTDAQGYYSFKLRPTATTHYRTVWNGQVTSEREVQVQVAPRLVMTASAVGKASVRYTGRIAPAQVDGKVTIQRRAPHGSWRAIATRRLHAGTTFTGRMRARQPVELRAFFASDGALLNGVSRAVRVVPGAAKAAAAAACRAPRVVRVVFKPTAPVAGRGATLRVTASLPGGEVYAVDVRWGERDRRDHFTLAPALRKARVVFALRHRYARAGRYVVVARAFGAVGACRRRSVGVSAGVRVVPA